MTTSLARGIVLFVARISTALALLALGLAAIDVSAQNVPQPPAISVSTRLVQIGVIVRDKNGPVKNLTERDFELFDQGKARAITVFSVESAEPGTPVQTSQTSSPNTFSNLPQDKAARPRSVTVVLLDNLNTLYGSSAESQYEHTPYWLEDLALRDAQLHLMEFIKQLQPQDRVAIYGLRHSLHILCDFTNDREQLLAILKNYDTRSVTNRRVVEPGNTMIIVGGHDHPADDIVAGAPMSGFENRGANLRANAANEDRGAETMAALRQIAGHVANIPGRKNLVWLTANLPFPAVDMARVLSPANIAVYSVDARGLLPQSAMVLENISGTADADDVSGASGHLDNMPAQSAQPIGIPTMQKLADETGGQAFVNTNDITGAIRKAVEDSAVTYTLGFYINRDALDGKFHEVKVKVRGQGLTVHYPKGYFAYSDTAPTKDEDQRRLLSAVQSPVESSSIPVQVTVERVDQPPHWFKVMCSIDAHHLSLVQSGDLRKGVMEVYIVEQDQAGKVLLQSGKSFTLQFPENKYDALLKSGLFFHELVEPKSGAITLRVLVEDPATSEVGSLIIPLSQVK